MSEKAGAIITCRVMQKSDITDVVNIHQSAFPEFFLTSLGLSFLKRYYNEICNDSNSITLVAVVARQCIGFVVGARNPAGFYRRLFKKSGIIFGLLALPAMLRRPWIAGRILRARSHSAENPIGEHVFGLFSIGVDVRCQSKGIGEALVDQFLEEVGNVGGRTVWLTTDKDNNDKVNRFYQKKGFALHTQFSTKEGRWMNEYVFQIQSSDERDGE